MFRIYILQFKKVYKYNQKNQQIAEEIRFKY